MSSNRNARLASTLRAGGMRADKRGRGKPGGLGKGGEPRDGGGGGGEGEGKVLGRTRSVV